MNYFYSLDEYNNNNNNNILAFLDFVNALFILLIMFIRYSFKAYIYSLFYWTFI